MSADETVTEATASRRPSTALIALAAVVVLAVLWVFVVQPLLLGDGSDDVVATAATDASPPAAAPGGTPAPELDAEAELLPAVTYEVFLSRDPFEPVVPEPSSGGGDATTETTAETAPPPTLDPVVGEQPADPPADPPADDPQPPASGCDAQGDGVNCSGRLVTLLEVTGRGADALAVIQVDTTVHEVAAGETFAGSFRLAGIDGACVDVQYGDDTFRLCEGDRVLK